MIINLPYDTSGEGGSSLMASGVTTGTATAYVLTDENGDTELVDGANIQFRLHVASGASATIDVNGTGAKSIKTIFNEDMSSGIVAGAWLTAIYSSASDAYILVGSSISAAQLNSVSTQVGSVSSQLANYMPIAGGTFTGQAKAQSNTAYTTYQLRNIALSTSAATPTGNGSILGVYS